MKSRTNQLDPRIIGGLRSVLMPNDVLTEDQVARHPLQLQGMEGYAVECLMDLQNLGTDLRGRLFRLIKVNCGCPFPFRCCVVGNSAAEGDFSFFLPASQVAAYADGAEEKEPKGPNGRPFTKDEFEARFRLGDPVCCFVKGDDVILTGQIISYSYVPDHPDRSLEIYIAGMHGPHSAEWLFNNMRYQPKGANHFVPFGVEGA